MKVKGGQPGLGPGAKPGTMPGRCSGSFGYDKGLPRTSQFAELKMDVDHSLLLPCSPVADVRMLDWHAVFLKNRDDAAYQHGVQGDFTPYHRSE